MHYCSFVGAGTGDARRPGRLRMAAIPARTASASPSARRGAGTGDRSSQSKQLAHPGPLQQFGHAQRTGLSDAASPIRLSAIVQFPSPAATVFGPEVDLGSNDQLFWFWIKRNQPPAVYVCRHDQFPTSRARQMIPIDPNWLVEALGTLVLDSQLPHQGPYRDKDNRTSDPHGLEHARRTEPEGHDCRRGHCMGTWNSRSRTPKAGCGRAPWPRGTVAIRHRNCMFPRPCGWSVPTRSSRCVSTWARCKSISCRATRPSYGRCRAIRVTRSSIWAIRMCPIFRRRGCRRGGRAGARAAFWDAYTQSGLTL